MELTLGFIQNIVKVYRIQKRFDEADKYVKVGESIFEQNNLSHTLNDFTGAKVKLYLAKNNPFLLKEVLKAEMTEDSLAELTQVKLNQDLAEKYERDKFEAKNLELEENQKLKEASIKFYRLFLIASIFSLLMISLLAYYLYRQRSNVTKLYQSLSAQKDQISLLNRELNHRVKKQSCFYDGTYGNARTAIGRR